MAGRTMLARRIARFGTPSQRALVVDFVRFGIVGASGFVVDTAVIYTVRAQLGLYWAGGLSYLVAATWTWAFNRMWTFAGQGSGPLWREWLRWMTVNASGLVFNRGAYVLLIAYVPACREHPVLAVAAGSVCGMFANFYLSRRLVFR